MQKEWKNYLKIGIIVFVLYLAIYYWENFASFIGLLLGAAMPVIIGFVIAYVINILMAFYEKHYFKKSKHPIVMKWKTPICMLLAILSLIFIIALVIGLVVPELVSCIRLLVSDIPPAIDALLKSEAFIELVPENMYEQLEGIDWKSMMDQFVKFLSSGLGSTVNMVVDVVSSVFSKVVTGVISFIFAIYFLLGKEQLCSQCKRVMNGYLPKKQVKTLTYVTAVLNDCFHRYIVGQFMEAVIIGVMCMVGMMILGFPYAGMIGALIGFTALIPVAGAYIGAVVGFVMILTVSPVKALLFLVFIVVLQQVEGNLIYPKVVGGSLGLPAVWVLAAVTVGGSLMGILGMLLGVPAAAALYRILREDLKRRERNKTAQS